jgi:hypothetical protein
MDAVATAAAVKTMTSLLPRTFAQNTCWIRAKYMLHPFKSWSLTSAWFPNLFFHHSPFIAMSMRFPTPALDHLSPQVLQNGISCAQHAAPRALG